MWRRIFGPVKENGVWRICNVQELVNLYRKRDIISEMRKRRLRWLGHVQRLSEERAVKMVFKNTVEGKRSLGNPRKRWLNEVESDLMKMGVRGWRNMVKD